MLKRSYQAISFDLPSSALLKAAGVDLHQYFGLWCVEPTSFLQMMQSLEDYNLLRHAQSTQFDGKVDAARSAISVTDESGREAEEESTVKIAVLSLTGMMTKRGSSLSSAGSSVRLRRSIRQAARDKSIDAILIKVDSPGGTVDGTADLADAVAEAAAQKPTWAFTEDLTASAAYWVASQASRIYANQKTARIGSIGTFIGLYDTSKRAEAEGVKAVVIKSGQLKGLGFAGTAITEAHQKELQGLVDGIQASFSAGVRTGRGLKAEAVAKLATGGVWLADQAVTAGLIDGIQSYEDTLEALAGEVQKRRSGPLAAPKSASLADAEVADASVSSTASTEQASPSSESSLLHEHNVPERPMAVKTTSSAGTQTATVPGADMPATPSLSSNEHAAFQRLLAENRKMKLDNLRQACVGRMDGDSAKSFVAFADTISQAVGFKPLVFAAQGESSADAQPIDAVEHLTAIVSGMPKMTEAGPLQLEATDPHEELFSQAFDAM